MSLRRPLALSLVLVAVFSSMGASYRTTNFVVQAPTPEIAERVGQWAEYYRKQKALEWLGYEMPKWPQPCPLHVTVDMNGPRGATTFDFVEPQRGGGVRSQHMDIKGPLDRLIYSVLPHEVTHTVFAFYFRRPVPRWADEGGAVLSEDDVELEKHNKIVRNFLNGGREFPLRRLLSLSEYPRQPDQVVCLYAQGFSLAHYLVHIGDKQRYLKFVHQGMSQGWDGAAHAYFGCRSVEELEQNWKKHMRDTKGVTIAQMARDKAQGQLAQAQPTARTVVRTTLPPAEPLAGASGTPVVRGVAPSPDPAGQRPGYLPNPAAPATAPPNWQPPRVGLRPPEFDPRMPDVIGQPQVAPAGTGSPGR
jgi:hypothetical protein